jgi:hypothetical protein
MGMTAVPLNDLVNGLAVQLEAVPGLSVDRYFSGQIVPPKAIVGVPAVPDYWTSGRGATYTAEVSVYLFVASAMSIEAQAQLAEYADPAGARSIPAAIHADKTLGGLAADSIVREFRPLNLDEYGAFQYYGGVFTIQIFARGR